MRIGQSYGSAMNGISSGTKKIGGVSLPDFNNFYYCTKTTPAMSDDKFREAIIEQAKKDYAAGKYQNSAESRRLQKQYVSVVSPDRKGIITKGLTDITKKQPIKNIDFIYLLFSGKVKYEKGSEGLSYAEFYDNDGNMIATYSNNGWNFYGTKEEFARQSEFCSIYSEAWRNTQNTAKNSNTAIEVTASVSLANESSFEALA